MDHKIVTALLSIIVLNCNLVAANQTTAGSAPTVDTNNLAPGKKFIRTYNLLKDWRGQTMTYHVNLPPDFRADTKYPILFEWHGKGGGPSTNVFPRIYKITGHIHVGLTYPIGCRGGTGLLYATPKYVSFIRAVYDDVVKNFNGNPDYVFLSGYSAGGFMACGPGVSLMIRAKLRKQLAGIAAGGCSWMCNPKYAKNLNILLWYSDNDSNSYQLPARIPQLKKYAKSLKVILHPGAGHRCDNNFEGPQIRKFFALNGPDKKDFEKLHKLKGYLKRGAWKAVIKPCYSIVKKHNSVFVPAQKLFNEALGQMNSYLEGLIQNDMYYCHKTEAAKLFNIYHDIPQVWKLNGKLQSQKYSSLSNSVPPRLCLKNSKNN